MIPKQIAGDPNALVIIDWSWWVRRAWHITGLDGVMAMMVGQLARLLSDPMPPSIVAAVDTPALTFRHRATLHMPPEKRYKGNRPPKPPELIAIEERLLEVLYAHRIPCLVPEDCVEEQTWEADDSGATAALRAQAEGRSVALLTIDKDWLQIVSTSDPTKPPIVQWDGAETVIGEDEVLQKWDVTVDQMTDLLAIMGDSGDNVPGVKGIGQKGAARLLWEYGSLDAALVAEPTTRPLRLLHEQRDAALFSRSMVKLWTPGAFGKDDPGPPIQWEPDAQMTGDFDVRALTKIYRDLGFSELARSIPTFPKQHFYAAQERSA